MESEKVLDRSTVSGLPEALRKRLSEDGPSKTADVVQSIMIAHWNMTACECWVCHEGRVSGLSSDYFDWAARVTETA